MGLQCVFHTKNKTQLDNLTDSLKTSLYQQPCRFKLKHLHHRCRDHGFCEMVPPLYLSVRTSITYSYYVLPDQPPTTSDLVILSFSSSYCIKTSLIFSPTHKTMTAKIMTAKTMITKTMTTKTTTMKTARCLRYCCLRCH